MQVRSVSNTRVCYSRTSLIYTSLEHQHRYCETFYCGRKSYCGDGYTAEWTRCYYCDVSFCKKCVKGPGYWLSCVVCEANGNDCPDEVQQACRDCFHKLNHRFQLGEETICVCDACYDNDEGESREYFEDKISQLKDLSGKPVRPWWSDDEEG